MNRVIRYLIVTDDAYQLYYEQSIVKSFLFVAATMLLMAALFGEIIMSISVWPRIAVSAKIVIVILIILTPLPWIRLLLQHSRMRQTVNEHLDARIGRHSLKALLAKDSLRGIINTYVLVNLSMFWVFSLSSG
jgi:predicted ABC-type exoprotein transport system permease subunit